MQAWFDAMSKYCSPYDLNPLNINPLAGVIARFVDFDAVRGATNLRLFVSATNVENRAAAHFPARKDHRRRGDGVGRAADDLPCCHDRRRAVWDGGYMGNPVIFPFFGKTTTEDVLIVQINPIERPQAPTSAHDIMNRVNEITFNSSLLAEYRAIAFVARLIDQGRLPRGTGTGQYQRINAHRIVLGDGDRPIPPIPKSPRTMISFASCITAGRQAAQRFLAEHSTISACAAASICAKRPRRNGRNGEPSTQAVPAPLRRQTSFDTM